MTNEQKAIFSAYLIDYIREKHTQEECSGFIDGFEAACQVFAAKKYAKNLIETLNFSSGTTDPSDTESINEPNDDY